MIDTERGKSDMKVNRYINGIPLSENELQGMKITNDIVQQTFLKVRNERIYYQKKEEEKMDCRFV